MRRRASSLLLLLALGCGSAQGEPDPAPSPSTTVAEAPAGEAPPEADAPPAAEDGLAIPTLWRARAPVVTELVSGEIFVVEESWSIGSFDDQGLSGLVVRSRLDDREATFAAGCARLEDHDPQYSLSRTAMSAVVDGVSIRLAIPGFFPGQLDVAATVGATPAEVVEQCPRLAPLSDELAALEEWPSRVRRCSRTLRAEGEASAQVELRVDEPTARAWLRGHGFEERATQEDVEVQGLRFDRGGDAPATARWHASEAELLVMVGVER